MSRLVFHECLGRGGYGEVYRCTWIRTELEMEVAVKVLNASVARGSDAEKRLKDEARLLGALTHPGILRVYDLVDLDGQVAMLAEFVDGSDLDRCVLEGLPGRALLECVSRVASALAAAWGDISPVSGRPLRLVHRDVKPENVRITPHGEVKLLDFGVARAAEVPREARTGTNTVMGSFRYMAPERFDANVEPHPSMDVFALGCILYEGLAFRRLFEHLSMREMLVLSLPGSDRYEEFVEDRLSELPASVEPSTVQLIRRLVHRDPSVRPLPGRLAALCDDEAERSHGEGLSRWCRSRDWFRSKGKRSRWTGREITVSVRSEHGDEFPTNPGMSGDVTISLAAPQYRDPPDRRPNFGPEDLAFGETDLETAEVLRPPPPPRPPRTSATRDGLYDAPVPRALSAAEPAPRFTDAGSEREPDLETTVRNTESVDLAAIRERVQAERRRMQTKRDRSTSEPPHAEEVVPAEPETSETVTAETEEPEPTPVPKARISEDPPVRKRRKPDHSMNVILANVAVLVVLGLLAIFALVAWVALF